eukprot:CAMPEP_0170198692 /NCGR_PEP_ID=MMETSP0040_2-20121228/68921_1 /TAXON_ID=641309 /ORGANISM="Lotharella oceanica, Strain CCMP622" /LENGTH=229 /DNA_ID=CAMNT_0010448725 /DNA_START=318 /DNA_END=1007 /DNA_ORIENTATION=-
MPSPMFNGPAIQRKDSEGAVMATDEIPPTMRPVPAAAWRMMGPPRNPTGLIINPIPAVVTPQRTCLVPGDCVSSTAIQAIMGAMPQRPHTTREPTIPVLATRCAIPVRSATVADAAVMPRPPFVLQGYSPREASSMGTVAYDDIAVRALEPLTNIEGTHDSSASYSMCNTRAECDSGRCCRDAKTSDDIAVRALEPLTNIHGVLDAEEPLGIRLPFDGAPSVVEVSHSD